MKKSGRNTHKSKKPWKKLPMSEIFGSELLFENRPHKQPDVGHVKPVRDARAPPTAFVGTGWLRPESLVGFLFDEKWRSKGKTLEKQRF